MTDVASHADTSPDDGRRPTRTHRARRGLRVPGAVTPAGSSTGPSTGGVTAEDARSRHRRAPGTAPFAVPAPDPAAPAAPAAPARSRHRAEDPADAFDPDTFGIRTGTPTGGHAAPRTGELRARHRPDPSADPVTGPIVTAGDATALTTAVTTATSTGRHAAVDPADLPAPASTASEAPTALTTGGHRRADRRAAEATSATSVTALPEPAAPTAPPGHARPKRRTGLPLRATIGVVGGGGVAALFALTTPGSPLPTSAPNDPQPSVAAPAGLFDSVLPSTPGAAPSSPSLVPVAPSEITTTPTEDGPQPVIGALFDAAAGAFDDLFNNSGNEGLVENGPRPRIVANPDDPSREAWRFALGPGGKRSEVLPQGPGTEPTDGDEQYIRYTAQLSDDFPTDTSLWQLILQWHHTSPNGSPPLALQVTQGQLYMVSEGDDMQAIGPVSPGQRIDLTMRVKFSRDPGEGSVTVWRDGRATGVTDWSPRDGTMSTRQAYMKMGLYRAPAIREGGSIVVTDLKIGRNAEGIGGIGPRQD
ncbi:heparin lyase I family protein [Actinomycetospora aeridis]|uniref:Heparin lyase I family protein n=1 Tax=Actinomycetospora aeridis TaxID=3129231 RepID=A0ABU8N7Z5_9PSEU